MRFLRLRAGSRAKCEICGRESTEISALLKVCANCVRERFGDARPYIEAAHAQVRKRYGLPPRAPKDPKGVRCGMCGNDCRIPEGGKGFCGVVKNIEGKLVREFGTPDRGLVSWYCDAIPTNCVAAPFCAGSSGAGYPKWCRTPRGDIGYMSLAVFLGSCTYSCLFCQNYSFRDMTVSGGPTATAVQLAREATEDVGCICYFGGDPASQMPFVIKSAELARAEAARKNRLLRVCLETNLNMNPRDLERFGELSIESGGGIKADLKCWSSEILYALSGVEHRAAYENFKRIGKRQRERPEVPFARASTLLVPGYVDEEEIRGIASFIADIDPSIPYSLLAFHPLYYMDDMPYVKREKVDRFMKICAEEGLQKVRLGNPWLVC